MFAHNQTHLYFVVLDVTRSISGAMSISDCDPCLPGRFSVLDVLGKVFKGGASEFEIKVIP